jgi:hypothetical protein
MTETIPIAVSDALRAYRDAITVARSSYERQRDAAHRGDKGTVDLLEKSRQDRVMAIDRTRRCLDEAVRAWGAP